MKLLHLLALSLVALRLGASEPAPRHVILITIDGLRWQEVFQGADEQLFDKTAGGVPNNVMEALRRDFGGRSADERRRKLMPFFWSTVVVRGSAFGNRELGSVASVANRAWVSYPGYNELLTGHPDPRITNNDPSPNPNVTVLEWLNARPAFAGRVAVSAAWRTFTAILNLERSRLPAFITPQHSPPGSVSPRIAELEQWMDEIPPITPDEHFDAFVQHAAFDFLETRHPRLLMVAYGESDEWAHGRRYDRYLYSIRRCDRFIQQLWEKLESLPEYRGTTTLLLTPDHGRGATAENWTGHGQKTPRSDETWLAAFGPGIAASGERRQGDAIQQAQVAATIASLLGENYNAAVPEAAPPIAALFAPTK